MIIVFDIDGVMNRLLFNACKHVGVNASLIKKYDISENTTLTDEQKKSICEEFSRVENYELLHYLKDKNSSEYDELLRLSKLPGVTLKVNSLSLNDEIRDYKRRELGRLSGIFTEENISLDLCTLDNVYSKQVEKCDILIEDCLENLLKAHENNPNMQGILINMPYNKGVNTPDWILRASDCSEAILMLDMICEWGIA